MARNTSFFPGTASGLIKQIIFFYGVMILGGTLLLGLPAITLIHLNFTDALFTSASAVCLNGQTVADTATTFTWQGKLLLLLLMQAGGIGAMFFSSLLFFCLQKGKAALGSAAKLLQQIIALTLVIELLGAAGIFFLWNEDVWFDSLMQKAGYSLFHSVSSFCNAGFSLFSNGMAQAPVNNCYLMHLMMALIIFFGSMGFPAITDMFSRSKLRERLRKPDQPWDMSTRFALYTSMLLVLSGAAFFWYAEADGVLQGQRVIEKAITALFHSASARTAGFASVHLGSLSHVTLAFFMLLMFVGASPGSTGGGVQTSIVMLLLFRVVAFMRGKKELKLAGTAIPQQLIRGAVLLLFFAVACILLSTGLLYFTEPGQNVFSLLFGSVSAFSSTGFSLGVTTSLSTAGKWIMLLTMLAGRVGMLCIAARQVMNYMQKQN